MRVLSGANAEARVRELAARGNELASVEPQVRKIVNAVRRGGDDALRKYGEKWDGLQRGQESRVTEAEMRAAARTVSREFLRALQKAVRNIRQFSRWQKPKGWTRSRGGITFGQLVRPLESVGCYVPGGRYPLVSTLLMTVIPARVAGVKRIVVVSPRPATEVLAAASMLGVKEFYRVGGAQAIAALAYGTGSIQRVDKIVGPGNLFVTAAKKVVAFDCAIDFLAGPTEVVVLSDEGRADFIAADLVAQAEHGPEALPVFITTSRKLADAVATVVDRLLEAQPAAQPAVRSWGLALVAKSRQQALGWAKAIAPEHITVSRRDLPFVRNAGSVFVGDYSPQAAGDYASGPNHVLPTGGGARFRGGLSVADFVKVITVQEISKAGIRRLGPTIECLAMTEGLRAHAESVRVRYDHA